MPDLPSKPRARRRVVMLVDNDVKHDSRVQKQAVSMAERGWDVVLLGLHPKRERSWRLGKARVSLLVENRPSGHNVRSLRWRDPFAHATMALAKHKAIDRASRLADRRSHRAGSQKRSLVSRVAGATRRLQSDVASFRLKRTERAVEARRFHTAPVDRLVAGGIKVIHGVRSWRWLDPSLLALELAYGPTIDRLNPDLIHANDFRTLGVAARAKMRAASSGRDVKVLWDAHEYVPGIQSWRQDTRWLDAQIAHEREYASYADAVTTVSTELAAMLQRDHRLAAEPTVVMNCPAITSFGSAPSGRSLREDCGIGPSVPLIVYSGTARASRGLDLMIEALPALPDVICALIVSDPSTDYVQGLFQRATELGVEGQLRALNYVPADEVVSYLAEADLGAIPIQRFVNHEIALITKFFEYAHAKLPMLVSDVRAMADEVARTGIGEVFTAGDIDDFARAARKMLDNPTPYREAYEQNVSFDDWSWEAQANQLARVYDTLVPPRGRAHGRGGRNP